MRRLAPGSERSLHHRTGLTFDFQQDYIDHEGVRYYALRIPYSIINELHQREFTALKQPSDELAVNETVDAVGFDFIRTPVLKSNTVRKLKGELAEEGSSNSDLQERGGGLRADA